MCELVEAKRTTVSPGRRIQGGTVMCAEDPAVKRAPDMFRKYQVRHYCGGGKSPVETTTAAPGELRDVAVYACDHPGCDATAKSPAGLAAHKRSHNGDSE